MRNKGGGASCPEEWLVDETEGVRKEEQWRRNHSGGSSPGPTTFWSEQQIRVVINACIIATKLILDSASASKS